MNSAEKVAALLRILGQEPYAHSVTSLGEKIGCGKSGAYKLLSVLVQNGLAAQKQTISIHSDPLYISLERPMRIKLVCPSS